MQPFVANLKNELFKLSRRKKYIVFLILGALVCVGSALRVLAADLILDEALPRELLVGGLTGENLLFLLLLFLPLMALMGCCDLFAGEQADHTLRFSLMRPVGKGKLFFSKAAAVFLLCLFDLVALLAVSAAAQLIMGGGSQGIARSVASGLLDLVPLAVLILFFCLVNQLVKGSGLAVLVCLAVYVALVVVGTYVPAAGGLLFTGYLRWHNLWVGVTLPFKAMLTRIGILAGYGLVFGSCGYLLFDRKEA
jgi:ABC-2 type transport system permease protein